MQKNSLFTKKNMIRKFITQFPSYAVLELSRRISTFKNYLSINFSPYGQNYIGYLLKEGKYLISHNSHVENYPSDTTWRQ